MVSTIVFLQLLEIYPQQLNVYTTAEMQHQEKFKKVIQINEYNFLWRRRLIPGTLLSG